MRDLQECQAEIFRLSEKRIIEKKQRRMRAFMVCIPLTLCIAVLCVSVFPEMKSTDIDSEAFTTTPVKEMYDATVGDDVLMGLFVGSVSVSGNGISQSYTSAEAVQGILSLLDSIVTASKPEDFATNESVSTSMSEINKDKGYKLFIKRADGSGAEYLLLGPLLIDQNTQEQFSMNGDTYSDLKDALGIPLY